MVLNKHVVAVMVVVYTGHCLMTFPFKARETARVGGILPSICYCRIIPVLLQCGGSIPPNEKTSKQTSFGKAWV